MRRPLILLFLTVTDVFGCVKYSVSFCNFTHILQMIQRMAQKEYKIKLIVRELVRKIIDFVSFPIELK